MSELLGEVVGEAHSISGENWEIATLEVLLACGIGGDANDAADRILLEE